MSWWWTIFLSVLIICFGIMYIYFFYRLERLVNNGE
jgi:hypothetical protein